MTNYDRIGSARVTLIVRIQGINKMRMIDGCLLCHTLCKETAPKPWQATARPRLLRVRRAYTESHKLNSRPSFHLCCHDCIPHFYEFELIIHGESGQQSVLVLVQANNFLCTNDMLLGDKGRMLHLHVISIAQ
ncbi:hypothetical protein D3C78_1414730 [compost metagenome]